MKSLTNRFITILRENYDNIGFFCEFVNNQTMIRLQFNRCFINIVYKDDEDEKISNHVEVIYVKRRDTLLLSFMKLNGKNKHKVISQNSHYNFDKILNCFFNKYCDINLLNKQLDEILLTVI